MRRSLIERAFMTRRLYDMEVVEYYFEWYLHKQQVVEHKAWYDDERYVVDVRPSMRTVNLYRLILSDESKVVVSERHKLTVERY